MHIKRDKQMAFERENMALTFSRSSLSSSGSVLTVHFISHYESAVKIVYISIIQMKNNNLASD